MVRLEGLEPPTRGLGNRCSILLSYRRMIILARPEGLEPPTSWFVASYSILLSYGRASFIILADL